MTLSLYGQVTERSTGGIAVNTPLYWVSQYVLPISFIRIFDDVDLKPGQTHGQHESLAKIYATHLYDST